MTLESLQSEEQTFSSLLQDLETESWNLGGVSGVQNGNCLHELSSRVTEPPAGFTWLQFLCMCLCQ